jgi:regulator of sigma E protease
MGSLSALGGGLIGYVVPFLFVLTIVVFFHELGHFLMPAYAGSGARLFRSDLAPFAGLMIQYGTLENFASLGGYVKFFGDNAPDRLRGVEVDADRKDSFMFQPVRSRAAVVAAGLSQISCWRSPFCCHFRTVGKQTTSAGLHGATGQRRGGAEFGRSGNRDHGEKSELPTCSVSSASAPATPVD